MDPLLAAGIGLVATVGVLTWRLARLGREQRRMQELVAHTNEKLERLQQHFGRFTPPEVIEHLTEAGGQYAPDLRTVTVLFADLKGFTKMCHELPPEEVVRILNEYFQRMSEVVNAHHGQVTELMGDGTLAMFGALKSNPWQVLDAVRGALAMRAELARYNEELRARSLRELAFGIGIHQGEVLAGVMGNLELSKFGVVGDPINVAARVEQLTRIHECDLLITTEVREGLDDRFRVREMPAVAVKGKEDPLVTWFVEALDG
jgi:adenylate cyclase